MAEYIEREATIKLLRNIGSRDYRREKGTIQEAIKMVSFSEHTPAADVSPARHGRWVKIYENGEPAIEQHQVGVFCSRCNKMPKDRFTESDFCPNCGAKMDEGKV